MDFKKLITKRHSVREYKNLPVDRELIEEVLDAGRMAPSAVNYQPWEFIVIRDNEVLQKVFSCYNREWFKSAPVVIVVCGNKSKGWRRNLDGKNHTDIDVAIATDHMTLQAAELGLGTCWVCNFNPHLAKEVLNLPDELEPIVMLPLGYAAENDDLSTKSKNRKPLSHIVHWETYAPKI